MIMTILLRSRTLRLEVRARPLTIRPMRSPLCGYQVDMGDTLMWFPRLPSRTALGLEVWP